jgi:hypothetical protein
LLQHKFGVIGHGFTRLSQLQTLGLPKHQWRLKIFFKLLDPQAGGRNRQKTFFGRPCQIQLFPDVKKKTQICQVVMHEILAAVFNEQ